jgi:photosystem II stability/assembly factor-like uncharacterized protein
MDAVVTRIVADPKDDKIAYAAVWYQDPQAGGGVFRSEDEGQNWKLIGPAGEAVRALEMAPSQSDEFIAGTRTGVFRSQDRGKNWERISPAGDKELRNLDSVAVDPKDANTIYAGTYHLPWKTTDGGKTWKPVIAGLIDDSDIMSLRVDATDPAKVYLSACSGIYRSDNGGEQWLKLQGIPYAARRTQAIVQDPQAAGTLYAATTEGLWVTRDGGESWERTTPREWVVNSVVVVAGESGKGTSMMIGTEAQGVLVSSDQGKTFTPQNKGFAHTVTKELEPAWQEPKHLLMVVERSGQEMWESFDGGVNWVPMTLVAASVTGRKELNLSAAIVAEVYGSPWGWLLRTSEGRLWLREDNKTDWAGWKLALPTQAVRGTRKSNLARTNTRMLKVLRGPWSFDAKSIWVGTQDGVARCERGGSCSLVKAFGKSSGVTTMMAKTDGRTIYATAGNKFAVSEDDGKTAMWRDLPSNIQAVNWMASGSDEKTLFLATDHGLYASGDEGVSWQKREAGLPSGRIEEQLQNGDLFMATLADGGMYVSQDRGMNWNRVDRDTERGHFTGLAAVATGVVVVGSQSEGLLQLTLKAPR